VAGSNHQRFAFRAPEIGLSQTTISLLVSESQEVYAQRLPLTLLYPEIRADHCKSDISGCLEKISGLIRVRFFR
jgi:hypothetical protein